MENFLRSKEYWQVVSEGIPVQRSDSTPNAGQRSEFEAQKLKDLKAKNFLFQAIDRTILETILSKDTSKEIWDSMKKKFQGSARSKRQQLQALRAEFEQHRMEESETVSEYFSRTMAVVNKMRKLGDKIEDLVIIEKILRSMSPKFNYVVCAIEESKDIENYSIDELQGSLQVHERKIVKHDKEEQALKAAVDRSADWGRGRGRGRGRGSNNGEWRTTEGNNRQGSFDKSQVECFRCHKLGHYRSECYTKMPRNRERMENSNFAETEEEKEEILLMTYTPRSIKADVWYLDTGCSNHMCGQKSFFHLLNENHHTTVSFGDSSTVSVRGKGDIHLKTRNGFVETISDVLYVPSLKCNLLSAGQLQENGYVITIQKGACEIYEPVKGSIVVVPMSSNRLFPLQVEKTETCLATQSKDPSRLWHLRYGHLNFGGLQTLHKKNMVDGLPKISDSHKVCETCVVGKQPRGSFPQTTLSRAKAALELIHSDICGPITPTSNGGKRYLITFIDDLTRKTWIYFLTVKSEAFTVFKSFKTLVENETEKRIKTLRTDGGGEFCSNEFGEFCDRNGIRRHLTAPYSPQQNGVSERKNRTILDMMRSILSTGEVPKTFWPEAASWSVHVLNRSPTFAVKNVTPEEAWSDRKPSVDHFKVFGCIAYAHVPDEKRKKLDDKAEKCVFLGVSEHSKAYKLFNPLTQRVLVSRDVTFDEENTWSWNKKPGQQLIDADVENNDKEDAQVVTAVEPAVEDNENGSSGDRCGDQPVENNEHFQRVKKRPAWMLDYVSGDELSDEDPITHFVLFADCDPITYDEASKDEKWKIAMDEEIKSIERNNTWELSDLPRGQKCIGVKWVYKTKLNKDGGVDKFKARLVAKGYKQEFGVDYTEVFAPVARLDTIRLVISMAAHYSWFIFQLDVKSAFLHGELQEEVYVDHPPGYASSSNMGKVLKLKKALYGLKQAPRAWYGRINAYFSREGFEKCPFEHTLFTKHGDNGSVLIVCLYVDDLIYTGNDKSMFEDFKKSMMKEFEMSDLGLMHYFLGIEVKQVADGYFISQQKYTLEILSRFHMMSCNSVSTPTEVGLKLIKDDGGKKVNATHYKQIVGSLMYLTATRPDISNAVSLISRYMDTPSEFHLAAAKRILRYLKGTSNFGILYKKDEKDLLGYTDSDYAGDLNDRKSTSGYVFMLNSGAISWCSKKQPIVTLSSTEAEYVAASLCSCQAIWLRRLMETVQQQQRGPTTIFCDNVSAIKISKNPVLHARSKHIDVRYHFLRELCNDGVIDLVFCKSQDQVADILTKPLKQDTFVKLRGMLGVCSSMDAE